MTAATLRVGAISAVATTALRAQVLRPGSPLGDCIYPGDTDPLTLHLGARRDDGPIVAIASFYREAAPAELGAWTAGLAENRSWRLRGMAVHPELRGTGIGKQVLTAALALLQERHDLRLLWCNARLGALGFYENMGFSLVGAAFSVPGVAELHRLGVWRKPGPDGGR